MALTELSTKWLEGKDCFYSVLAVPLTLIDDSDFFGLCPLSAGPKCTKGPKWTPNGLPRFTSFSTTRPLTCGVSLQIRYFFSTTQYVTPQILCEEKR